MISNAKPSIEVVHWWQILASYSGDPEKILQKPPFFIELSHCRPTSTPKEIREIRIRDIFAEANTVEMKSPFYICKRSNVEILLRRLLCWLVFLKKTLYSSHIQLLVNLVCVVRRSFVFNDFKHVRGSSLITLGTTTESTLLELY